MTITASEIKSVKALALKKNRDESGLFVVEGQKMVDEAIHSRFEVVKLYRKNDIGEQAMSRMTLLNSPSPVLAVLKRKIDLDNCPSKLENGLYLALDSIRDPGNLGTILRISDWFGIKAVFASRDTVDVFNPKVVQSSMGAIFRVDFHYVDLEEFAHLVLNQNGKLYGTFLDGQNIYARDLDTGNDSPSAIIIGNEANGISDKLGRLVSDRLYIPPYPINEAGSESLNAAVATAITVAEFRRRCLL